MMGRSHALAGLAAGLAVAAVTDTVAVTPIPAYGLAAVAALIPDLDQHKALAARITVLKPLHFLLRGLGHRRLTHSLVGIALFSGALAGIAILIGALGIAVPAGYVSMGIAGYVSHIVADMFNKQGVQLFYPFKPAGLEWWSMPIPRPFRISTIHDPSGLPLTPAALQAAIHTEKWFFTIPVYGLIAYVTWHHAESLVAAIRLDVWRIVSAVPSPVSDLLTAVLG